MHGFSVAWIALQEIHASGRAPLTPPPPVHRPGTNDTQRREVCRAMELQIDKSVKSKQACVLGIRTLRLAEQRCKRNHPCTGSNSASCVQDAASSQRPGGTSTTQHKHTPNSCHPKHVQVCYAIAPHRSNKHSLHKGMYEMGTGSSPSC